MKRILVTLALVVVVILGVLLERRLTMTAPTGLGPQAGRLSPCPDRPNCVSSFASDAGRRVEPLTLNGDPEAALARLQQILEAMPRTQIVDWGDGYLHAEATSLIYRYIDDLEILIDSERGKIHLRSASRAGYYDLGVNRRRVRALSESFIRPTAGS